MRIKHCLAVIPDIHMRHQLFHEAVRLHGEGNKVVFLGDYVDNGPQPNDPVFLRELFEFCRKTGSTPLIGNHDLAYLFPDDISFRKNGYEPGNARAVAEVYTEFADMLQYVYRLDRYVCSHAGLSKTLLNVLMTKYRCADLDAAIAYLNEEQPPELYYCSPVNDGTDPFDGPMWLRLGQFHGALQDEGLTQIVGHSSQSTIRLKHNLLMIDVRRPLLVEWQERKVTERER